MASSATTADDDTMVIMPLGGGQEVGRSCILLQFRGRNILLDCGAHPGREGNDSLPFFDSLDDPSEIDLILITHFHIDHCAALPYFTEKTNFRGKIYMTHATKAVMKMLLSDNIKLQTRSRPLYTEAELQCCVDKIEVIDFHQTVEHKGVRFTPTAAGHVLGAAMFTVEIDGIRVLYTGDYSMEEDRHLMQAEVPPGGPPDVLIVESTFGVITLPPKEERESRFTAVVEDIVSRGGSCLIPVFALGRAQELLLILDEYWQAHPELHTVPVFYASKLASKALRVYQTFVNMMNLHIRTLMDVANPFKLNFIKNMLRTDFDTVGPCVVLASPGFMQSGVSRHLFERWCDDDRNGVVIAGYTVEGTLAHELLNNPKEIVCQDNRVKPRRCQIEFISFSAHVDYAQNSGFIRTVLPDNIVLVHGERTAMKKFKDKLEGEIRRGWPGQHKPAVAMPDNGIKVKLRFNKPLLADIVGNAAKTLLHSLDHPSNTTTTTTTTTTTAGPAATTTTTTATTAITIPQPAVLVSQNFVSTVVEASELPTYTSCRLGRLAQRLYFPLPPEISRLFDYLSPVPLRTPKEGSDSGGVQGYCPLLEMLLPYLAEIFDDVLVCNGGSGAEKTPGQGRGGGAEAAKGAWARVQGLVTLGTADAEPFDLSPPTPLDAATTAGSTTAAGVGGGSGDGGHGHASVWAQRAVVVTWAASPVADMVADCVVGAISQAFAAPNVLRYSMALANKPLPPPLAPAPPTSSTSADQPSTWTKPEAGSDGGLEDLLKEVAAASASARAAGDGAMDVAGGGSGGDGGGMDSLDDLLSSVGQELLSGAGAAKTEDSAEAAPASSSSSASAASSSSDALSGAAGAADNVWLWTSSCRRKRCRHTHAPAPGENCDGIPASAVPGPGPGPGPGGAASEVLRLMRSGEIDPSKALPPAALALAAAATATGNGKARLARLCELLVAANHTYTSAAAAAAAPPAAGRRGRKADAATAPGQGPGPGQGQGRFESIKLNADGTKLIFRGTSSAGEAVVEAYVFVAWENDSSVGAGAAAAGGDSGEEGGVGAGAVVQCDDEGFRQAVLAALTALNP